VVIDERLNIIVFILFVVFILFRVEVLLRTFPAVPAPTRLKGWDINDSAFPVNPAFVKMHYFTDSHLQATTTENQYNCNATPMWVVDLQGGCIEIEVEYPIKRVFLGVSRFAHTLVLTQVIK
jgi:hypothetical protein